MKHLRNLIILLGFSMGLPVTAQTMRTFEIMDNQGFGRPMIAHTIDVPTDWSVRGEILWQKPCSSSDVYELVLEISSPDGLSGFRIQPGHKLFWTDMVAQALDPDLAQIMVAQAHAERAQLASQLRGSNCHVTRVESADQLFQGAVTRPADMQITGTKPNEPLRQQYQSTFQSAPGMTVYFDAQEIAMHYTLSGQPVDETLFFSWYMIQLDPLDPNLGTFMQNTVIEPLRSVWISANRRQQDEAILQKIIASFQTDPGWQAEMDGFYARLAAQNQANADQRRDANEQAWQQHQASVAERNVRNDAQHQQFMEMILQ